MRKVLSISLSEDDMHYVKTQAKRRGFGSTSEYIRHLIREQRDMMSEQTIMRHSREAVRQHKKGQTKRLRSLQDLMSEE